MIGTPFWMAPELLLDHDNSLKADVYAFGIRHGVGLTLVKTQTLSSSRCPTCMQRPRSDLTFRRIAHSRFRILRRQSGTTTSLYVRHSASWSMLRRLDTNSMGPRVNGGAEQLLNEFPQHISDKLRKGEIIEPESRQGMCNHFFQRYCRLQRHLFHD
jgi:hypothetical protein